jgi:hypothetical protein
VITVERFCDNKVSLLLWLSVYKDNLKLTTKRQRKPEICLQLMFLLLRAKIPMVVVVVRSWLSYNDYLLT